MNFTPEQLDIIHSTGNIKINAVAGSGKTSTLLGYAKERRNAGPILYIAFNKSVKLEAERKFATIELSNVRVETAHSLAYCHIVKGSSYKVRRNGVYKIHEIVQILGRHHLIKDRLIAAMKHFSDLEEYIDKTEDAELGLMVEIVKKYHGNLPDYIRQIKEAHVENHEKDKAGMIFSTVHRSKGLEYDEVTLVNDFITEDKIIKLVKEIGFNTLIKDKLAEEINLLYVAVTRTKNRLNIPEELLPKSLKKHL